MSKNSNFDDCNPSYELRIKIIKNEYLTLIGKSWKTHPEIFLKGAHPLGPLYFFLSAKSTGDIKFLVLSDPLNTILQKKWVVTGILSWELRFEIA